MAAAVRRGDSKRTTHDCAVAARELVQLAAFVQLCRRKRLLPDATSEKTLDGTLQLLRSRFGPALLRSQVDDSVGSDPTIDTNAWQLALSRMADIDTASDVLAHMHQRLLGRRLADDGQGGWRSLPESSTQKVGGVFYTPDYVARYMLEQALSRTSRTVPAILDPSCGCGAFLLAAFRALVARRDVDADDFDTRLQILRHIHGVDIDGQAVLVARRSLWLEMFSDTCSTDALGCGSTADFLAETVRVANTLADDFEHNLPAPSSKYDIIVGNPPYRRELGTKSLLDEIAKTRLGHRWRTARMDLWYYFVHRGLELLCDDGTLSFIVSGYWTAGRGAEKLIDQLRREAHIEEIFDLGSRSVFANVSGHHMILRIGKSRHDKPTIIKRAASKNIGDSAKTLLDGNESLAVFEKTSEQLFRQGRIDIEPPRDKLLAHIAQGAPLSELGKIRQGIAENPAAINRRTNQKFDNRWTVGEGVFALTAAEVAALDLPDAEKKLLRPYHDLCDLGRYRLAETPSRYLIYSTAETWPEFDMHPVLGGHLQRFRAIMDGRRETKKGARSWWQLHWPREVWLWQSAKIISVQMAARPAFVPARGPVYVPFSANVFVPDKGVPEHLNYFAAVLNSNMLWQWYRHHAKRRGVGLEINGRVLGETPIRRIDFNSPADRDRHDRLVELVDQMLAANGKNNDLIDGEIDEVVSELYGAEIR